MGFIKKEMSHLEGVLEYCEVDLYEINIPDPAFVLPVQNVTKTSLAQMDRPQKTTFIWANILSFILFIFND